ncbi:ABC transporter ATP-binding protein [Nostocoides sp.]|uniref:ABC transporter ATP-binding protein n=1 Tax=Nostocoides sp. TaxID=1917966 RepID=UPI003BAE7975
MSEPDAVFGERLIARDERFLEVAHLRKTFGAGESAVTALDEVSFTVPQGQFLAIQGRSGSGKTTLLNIVGGLDRADAGHVLIGGQDVTQLSDDDLLTLRRDHVAHIFQGFGLLPILTASENVGIPLRLKNIDPQEREQRVARALAQVGLAQHTNHIPAQLSGGQQQRVAIARALVAGPALLLADEPTGQLDSATARDIMDLLSRLVREQGMTAIVTTHDPILLSHADRVLALSDGHLRDDSQPGNAAPTPQAQPS